MSLSKLLAKKTAKKVAKKIIRKPTQKDIKFGKKKDMVMPKDNDIKLSTVSGTKGVTGKGEVINVGDDAVGFSNFLALQKSKGIFKREQAMRALEKIIDKGTPAQKKQAKSMLEKMEVAKKKSDEMATFKQGSGRRTAAKPDDYKIAQKKLDDDGLMEEEFKRLTKNQQDALIRSSKLKQKIKSPKESAKQIVRNRMRIPMSQGGLKMPSADQTGLKKLPTQVRNKMGYMYGGGMSKKPKMGNMDYRKGGMVMIVLDMMKKKKGKK